jgi:choline dehydrogenase
MYPNYFADQRDVDVIVAGTRLALQLVQTPAFAQFGVRLHDIPIPGCEHLQFATDEYWECHLRHYTMLFHHQVLCDEWLVAYSQGEKCMSMCSG